MICSLVVYLRCNEKYKFCWVIEKNVWITQNSPYFRHISIHRINYACIEKRTSMFVASVHSPRTLIFIWKFARFMWGLLSLHSLIMRAIQTLRSLDLSVYLYNMNIGKAYRSTQLCDNRNVRRDVTALIGWQRSHHCQPHWPVKSVVITRVG